MQTVNIPFKNKMESTLVTTHSNSIPLHTYEWEEFPTAFDQLPKLLILQPVLQEITYNSFQSKNVSFSISELEKAFLQSTNYFLLTNKTTKNIIGFAFINSPYATLFDGKFCYINKIAISSAFQGQGFASQFRKLLLDKGFTWLCARTQNPAIMHNFSANSIKTFPFKTFYSTTGEGENVMEFILKYIPQVIDSTKCEETKFDKQTGIFKGLYRHPLGNNYNNKSDKFINEASLLDNWRFDPIQGDAILVTSYFKLTN